MNEHNNNVQEFFNTHLRHILMNNAVYCVIVEVIPILKQIKVIYLLSEYKLTGLIKNDVFIEYYTMMCENSFKNRFIGREREVFNEMYIYSDGILTSVDDMNLNFDSAYDLDPDGNLVPKFKGYLEVLKDISNEAGKKGGKWAEWNSNHK